MQSGRYRNLGIEIAAWLEAGAWHDADDDGVHELDAKPIEIHAAEQLARRRKKIVKKSKALDRLDAEQRHKLRIAVKKFRYSTEFMASVFPNRKSEKRRLALLESMKRIQDCLGALNDIAVHEKLGATMLNGGGKASKRLRWRRVFAAGLVSGQEEARAAKLMAGAQAALADFTVVKSFWK